LYRITVIDTSQDKSDKLCLINPTIIKQSGDFMGMEGCLSFPGVYEKVKRFETITFEAMNENGEVYQRECDGLLAECVQHEIDHLNGILFVDKMSPLRRNRLLTKFRKIEKIKI
jgi:peptide deformylase